MNKMIFIIALAVFVIIGLAINYFGKKQKVDRALKVLPEKSVLNLKQGEFSKITGKIVTTNKTLTAPLSKKECVYYLFKVEQMVKSGKNNNWNLVSKKEDVCDFLVEKDGEITLIKPTINPKNFESYVLTTTKKEIDISKDISEDIKEILGDKVNSKGFLGFSKNVRLTEAIIEKNDEVTVGGVVNKNTVLNEPIEAYSYSKITTLDSNDKQKLIITNDTTIGSIKTNN